MLLIIRNKNHKNFKRLLMTGYNDLNIRNKKGVEARMKTIMSLWKEESSHLLMRTLCMIVFSLE
jgi:hypothetical protein